MGTAAGLSTVLWPSHASSTGTTVTLGAPPPPAPPHTPTGPLVSPRRSLDPGGAQCRRSAQRTAPGTPCPLGPAGPNGAVGWGEAQDLVLPPSPPWLALVGAGLTQPKV